MFLSVGRAVVILTQAGARPQCSWGRGACLCVCCCSRAGGRCTCSSSPPVVLDVPQGLAIAVQEDGNLLLSMGGGGGGGGGFGRGVELVSWAL